MRTARTTYASTCIPTQTNHDIASEDRAYCASRLNRPAVVEIAFDGSIAAPNALRSRDRIAIIRSESRASHARGEALGGRSYPKAPRQRRLARIFTWFSHEEGRILVNH